MSSPFSSFRKHKTYWMAGVVLLAILAFIVAPAIDSMMNFMGSSSPSDNEVVVRWSDGKITSGTLNYVRMQHARTVRFLQALAREVIAAGGMPKVPGFRYDPTSKRVEDLGLPMLETNQTVCQTLIIAERAKQLGIEFDKEVVDDFFVRFCDRKIGSKRFDEILKETAGRELSVSELYRQLSLELSAVVMERVALAGVNYEGAPLVTPGGLWQNYLRLNQSARIEAYPVLTSDFVKQVKETPSESEIRQLYDEGASNFPSPNSPRPGFRRRYQANVEYVSGSWNKLLEVEKAKISEEALRAEYDRLVGLGGLQVPADAPKPGEATPAEPDSQAQPDAQKTDPQPPSETPEKSGEASENSSQAAEKPSEGQPPAPKVGDAPAESDGAQPSGDQPGGDQPGGDQPEKDPASASEESPAAGAPDAPEAPAADPESQSRAVRPDGQIRLVAFQQDEPENKSEETEEATPPAVENPASPENVSDAQTPAPPTADAPSAAAADADTPDADTPAADTPADASNDAAAPAAAGAQPSSTQAAAAQPGNAPMRTQTFEEAKDSLARSLAMNVVRDQLQAKLTKIESAMNAYASKKAMERIQAESGRKADGEPAKIDLKKLAEAEGLTYGSTGLIDGLRLASTPVGRSTISNQALANTIMTPNVELYRPVRSMFIDMENLTDPDFQEFISWKIDEVAAYTPALTDIREEVIDTWKTQRARDLAKSEAQKLADKLKSAGDEPWKSVLDAQQQTLVINPPPFTWMSAPREMFAPAQVSFVQGLDTVGQEFMQRVFSTPPGQLTVAPNQGLNTFYVVRLLELTPTIDQLRQNFEISRGRARQLAFPERERMFSDWYENIERTLNVQWLASEETLMN